MPTLLLVDDSATARAAVRRVVEASGLFDEILEASDGTSGLRALLNHSIDLVLCDLEMPGFDGDKLLHAWSCRPDGTNTPFILLTGHSDPDRLARLLRAGASDTIRKPFHDADLLARLEVHLRTARLQAKLRDKNTMLERLATTDALTGLHNRRYVDEWLRIEALRARRYGAALSVLMMDLDHFKRVNDTHGHPMGDSVLACVGELVRTLIRRCDVAARYGGEEFLLLLPATGLEGAAELGERLREGLARCEFVGARGEALQVTASFGAAEFGGALDSPEALVRAADDALYRAKTAGRDRVECAPAGVASGSPEGNPTATRLAG